MFGGGLWSLVRAQVDASHEEAMIDLIGILLDRYGIIAPNTVSGHWCAPKSMRAMRRR